MRKRKRSRASEIRGRGLIRTQADVLATRSASVTLSDRSSRAWRAAVKPIFTFYLFYPPPPTHWFGLRRQQRLMNGDFLPIA